MISWIVMKVGIPLVCEEQHRTIRKQILATFIFFLAMISWNFIENKYIMSRIQIKTTLKVPNFHFIFHFFSFWKDIFFKKIIYYHKKLSFHWYKFLWGHLIRFRFGSRWNVTMLSVKTSKNVLLSITTLRTANQTT